MRILIYGAGVIGSLYAVLLGKAGIDTDIYARGKRLEFLQKNGLLYYSKGKVMRAERVGVISEVIGDDRYDFILLTVRENQLQVALEELRDTKGDIVSMVNSIEDYRQWEKICGKGRIIPAFPGAGGSITDNILDAVLTPALVQPTTFGELSGEKTDRIRLLKRLFRRTGIPTQVVADMHLWQLCHLTMVVPLADAYYEAKCPERAGYDQGLMRKTAEQLRRNFIELKKSKGKLLPAKLNVFIIAPKCILAIALSFVYKSSFGNRFMYQHSMKAPDEMRTLHDQLYAYMESECNR